MEVGFRAGDKFVEIIECLRPSQVARGLGRELLPPFHCFCILAKRPIEGHGVNEELGKAI